MSDPIRFIVAGMGRTRTTWMVRTLHRQPRVACCPEEIFHEGHYPESIPGRPLAWVRSWVEDRLAEERQGHVDPVAEGFKVNRANLDWQPALRDYFTENQGQWRAILLLRNPLFCMASIGEALKTGCWATDKPTVPQDPMSFSVKRAVDMIQATEAYVRLMRRLFPTRLEITYKAMLRYLPGCLDSVASFLGSPPIELLSTDVRINATPLPRRIRNFDELRRDLPHSCRLYIDDPDAWDEDCGPETYYDRFEHLL